MRRTLLLFLTLLTTTATHATPVPIHFRLSKPYALFNFLQTCDGLRSASDGLADLVSREGLLTDTAFRPILARWRALPLEYTYERHQFPEGRARSRHGRTSDLLISAAVQSPDLAAFRQRAIGILPNADHAALFRLLEDAAPTYDRLVWNPSYAALSAQVDSLNRYAPRISELFSAINGFYGTGWPSDIPFIVALYPVPGRRGGTAATPHNNALCIGVLTADHNWAGIAGVVLHEMCHSLYNEQPAALQSHFEGYFMGDTSRHAALAYTFIDEGLATALGNGWAFEAFSGRADTGEWYHNRYINGFGHALYPLVAPYLAASRPLDSAFARAAVRAFAATFPRAPYEYSLLLTNISLYSDAADADERAALMSTLHRHFRVSSYSASSPIADPTSLDLLAHNTATQLVVVRPGAAASLSKLKAQFPELATALRGKPAAEPCVVSFFDARGRAVVVVLAAGNADLEKALARLERDAEMGAGVVYRKL